MTALLERTLTLTWDEWTNPLSRAYDDDSACDCGNCPFGSDVMTGGDFFVKAYDGDTLVARGELRTRTILGSTGIWGIFVDENYRGQGHAKEVMRRLVEAAVEDGHKEIFLYVEATNAAAIALYQSLGWKFYYEPRADDTEHTMTLDLEGANA